MAAIDNIRVSWSGEGNYWLVRDDGWGELDLGYCYDENDLHKSIDHAINMGWDAEAEACIE